MEPAAGLGGAFKLWVFSDSVIPPCPSAVQAGLSEQ